MKINFLMVAAIAATFTASCAQMSRDRTASRTSDMATPTARSDGGAAAMFRALDKNNDGFISKAEAQGTPHEKDFDALDTNRDGRLSREEHAAGMQANQKSAASPLGDQRAAAPGTGGPGGTGGTATQRY